MKQVTMYQSEDGELYPLEAQAVIRDAEITAINNAICQLGERPGIITFDRGEYYVQHNERDVRVAYVALCKLVSAIIDRDVGVKAMSTFNPRGIIGRYIDDSGHKPLRKAWYRMMCIDDQWREWGQPYFVKNPNPSAKEFK